MGAITPLGLTLTESWNALLSKKSGETTIEEALRWQGLSSDQLDRDIDCCKKLASHRASPVKWFSKDRREIRTTPRSVQFALKAASEAIAQSGLYDWTRGADNDIDYRAERFGVCIGSGMSSVREICDAFRLCSDSDLNLNQMRKLSPYFVPRVLSNTATGRISIEFGLCGPSHSVSTACAAGSHAIGDAARMIQHGDADAMIAGGTESCIDPLSIAGFSQMRALSTMSQTDDLRSNFASRPFDRSRNGFVIGEGAAVLVLEEHDQAVRRNAPILAELCGYGLSGDAFHVTSPHPQGRGAVQAMRAAIREANANLVAKSPTHCYDKDDQFNNNVYINYVNAHATSTPKGDEIEAQAIQSVLSSISPLSVLASKEDSHCSTNAEAMTETPLSMIPPTFVSSTKGSTGHLLGAAGAIESAFTVLAITNQCIPPTLNLKDPCDAIAVEEISRSIASNGNIYPAFQHVFDTINLREIDKRSQQQSKEEGSQLNFHKNNTASLKYAMNNSFGFGGTNASLIFGRYHDTKKDLKTQNK